MAPRNKPPRPPDARHWRFGVATGFDRDLDLFGAEDAAAGLAERIGNLRAAHAPVPTEPPTTLQPPFASELDRFEGPPYAARTLVIYGALGTPSSRAVGQVVRRLQEHWAGGVCVAWRHFPDPAAHPRSVLLALAAEAAATHSRFWVFIDDVLRRRHDDPADLHAALVHAGLDHGRVLRQMRAGTGADRILRDVGSGLDSGVEGPPALFIDGERFTGPVVPGEVAAELAGRQAADGERARP